MNTYSVLTKSFILGMLTFMNVAFAQSFPDHPIVLVVPNPPGGLVDTSARLLSEPLTRVIGQPVVVDNKPGASGNTAYQFVAKAKPDGYTLLISYSGYHVGNPALMDKLPWDPVKDYSPIALLTVSTNVIAVHPSVPVNNLKEFIAYAKANPGKVRYGSSGPGSASHLAGELFASMAGVELLHVPYKGTGQALIDLLAGHIDLMFAPAQTVMPQIESGKLVALAQTGAKRSEALPGLPTIAESGLPGYSAVGWFGLFAPANTPKAVVQKINKTVMFVLGQDQVRRSMLERGSDPASGSADEFAAFLRLDQSKWAKLLKENKVAVQ